MTRLLGSLLVVLLVGGCAGGPAAPPAGGAGTTFTGEVWTWDEVTNVVTLRQGDRTIRVKVTPEQIQGLRLYQTVTVRGELAPPGEIQTFVTPPPTLVPQGPPDQAEVSGTVSAVDPAGKIAVDSPRGRLQVWVTRETALRPGDPVRVEVRVQPLEAVPAPQGRTPVAPARVSPPEPALPAGAAPGEYAVVTGRITAVQPDGHVTVESTRGPVEVWVENAARYRVGGSAEVRTAVHPAR